MPMNVTIFLKGDVIVYKRSKYWNIVLITDQHHVAKLSDNRGTAPKPPLRDPKIQKLQLQFEIASLATKTRTKGSNFATILDIGQQKLHHGNLKVVDNPANGRELIQLRMPVGEVDADTSSYADGYWYTTHSGNPNPSAPNGQIKGPIATQVIVTLDVGDPGGTVPALTLENTKGGVIHEWKYDSRRPLEIYINNECAAGAGGMEDFLHFYDWVSDKRDQPSTMGKPAVRHRFIAGKLRKKSGTRRRSPEGNCDPVVVDPPPFGRDPDFP